MTTQWAEIVDILVKLCRLASEKHHIDALDQIFQALSPLFFSLQGEEPG